MNYDPLQIMCELSDKYKLKIEAWINPYRVSQDNDYSKLCENNIALKWHNGEKTKEYVKECGNKLYFNPAYKEVNELIVNGVKEIAENYSVDGIHFDDYFYPTSDADFDSVAYDEYKKKGGDLSLGDWRRDNVSSLIKSVYKAIKKVNPDIRFGVSPASDIENDYTSLYADIEKWVSEDGYVDYVCPQIYFGFRNVKQPFMFTTKNGLLLCVIQRSICMSVFRFINAPKLTSTPPRKMRVSKMNLSITTILFHARLFISQNLIK